MARLTVSLSSELPAFSASYSYIAASTMAFKALLSFISIVAAFQGASGTLTC